MKALPTGTNVAPKDPLRRTVMAPRTSTALSDLPNVGAAIVSRLLGIGIDSIGELRRVGAPEAYRLLCAVAGRRLPLCYYLYSLEAAVRGIAWTDLSETEKCRLRLAAEADELGGPWSPSMKRGNRNVEAPKTNAQRTAETRATLLQLARVEFATHGFEDVSLDALAEFASLTRGSAKLCAGDSREACRAGSSAGAGTHSSGYRGGVLRRVAKAAPNHGRGRHCSQWILPSARTGTERLRPRPPVR
jgi:DNA transformation protein